MRTTSSTHLPPEAIAELQRASQTPITPADPLARVKAIEKATQRIKSRHPNLFQERNHHENQT